jgi:hypothetical protein
MQGIKVQRFWQAFKNRHRTGTDLRRQLYFRLNGRWIQKGDEEASIGCLLPYLYSKFYNTELGNEQNISNRIESLLIHIIPPPPFSKQFWTQIGVIVQHVNPGK